MAHCYTFYRLHASSSADLGKKSEKLTAAMEGATAGAEGLRGQLLRHPNTAGVCRMGGKQSAGWERTTGLRHVG